MQDILLVVLQIIHYNFLINLLLTDTLRYQNLHLQHCDISSCDSMASIAIYPFSSYASPSAADVGKESFKLWVTSNLVFSTPLLL